MSDDGSQPGDASARPRRKSGVLAAIGAVEHPDLAAPSVSEDLPELKPLPDLPLPEAAVPAASPDADHPEAVVRFKPVPPPELAPSDEPERTPERSSVLDPEAYLAAMERAAMERALLSRPSVDPPSPKPATDANRRRVRLIAITSALALLIGVAVILIWNRPACCGDGLTLPPSTVETGVAGIGTGPRNGGSSPRPGGTAKPGASAAVPPGGVPTAAPTQGASPTPGAVASSAAAPPAAAPLRASYRTTGSGLLGALGYRGEITLTNPNGTPATEWTVVLELVGNNEVVAADGAAYLQLGNTVTFIPADTGNVVPANGSTTFGFDVRGLLTAEPRSCTVDGRPCAG
jgi:hypothetical protein